MDSQRFLNLVDGLPEDSAFHKWAIRGGDWTDRQYMDARLLNEVALSRADGKGYMPQLVKSPMQLAQDENEDRFRRQRHNDTLRELRGEEDDDGDHR